MQWAIRRTSVFVVLIACTLSMNGQSTTWTITTESEGVEGAVRFQFREGGVEFHSFPFGECRLGGRLDYVPTLAVLAQGCRLLTVKDDPGGARATPGQDSASIDLHRVGVPPKRLAHYSVAAVSPLGDDVVSTLVSDLVEIFSILISDDGRIAHVLLRQGPRENGISELRVDSYDLATGELAASVPIEDPEDRVPESAEPVLAVGGRSGEYFAVLFLANRDGTDSIVFEDAVVSLVSREGRIEIAVRIEDEYANWRREQSHLFIRHIQPLSVFDDVVHFRSIAMKKRFELRRE